ncbi:MAG: hypothetical protein SGI98_12400 [Verrucomicrobiota bacterium]|nr:hypothetical protein [Verrucomicrobiota bacterium]
MAALNRITPPPVERARIALSDLEKEVVEVFVKLAQVAALPKSLGEIYGLLYISKDPLAMDTIMDRLSLSKGATSQGLKELRNFGAVRAVYIPGDRRDHYTPETELKKLVSGFLKEQLQPHVEGAESKLARLDQLVKEAPAQERKFYQHKIERLRGWHSRAGKLMPWVLKFLKV